jgi:hypothetical protein
MTTKETADIVGWLHVRSQCTYHHEAEIVGTRSGLEALQCAVEEALGTGTGTAAACASDGEGYALRVRRTSTIAGLGRPTYLDEIGRELADMERNHLVHTSRAVEKQAKEALEALRWCRVNGNPHLPTPPVEGENRGS